MNSQQYLIKFMTFQKLYKRLLIDHRKLYVVQANTILFLYQPNLIF